MTSSACAYTYYLYIRAACLITVRSLSKIEFFLSPTEFFPKASAKVRPFCELAKSFTNFFQEK